MISLLSSIALSLLLGICFGRPAVGLAHKFGLIDIPGSAPHKAHKFPIPLAGGVLIFLTLIPLIVLFRSSLNRDIVIVLMGSAVVFIFGLWDDRKGLSAKPKLLGQFMAVCILVFSGVQVHFVDTLYHAGYVTFFAAQLMNILITFFWLIGITNAVNMIDSMDGIVAGMAMIAFICYFYATAMSGQYILSLWSGVFLGICISLYYWNKIAGLMFLGDSGAQVMGFLLASMGILYNPRDFHPESSWFLPIMLLGMPIFDTTLVVFSRLKRNQPIGTGRRDHTYHRLIAMGFSPKVAVFATHIAALLVSGLAFFTLFLQPAIAMLIFFITLFCGILILIWFERKPVLDDKVIKTTP